MKDSRARSLIKGISWRCLGTLDTLLLSFLIFGDFTKAASIAATEIVTKIIFYYFHERIWNLIKWGRASNPPSHARSVVKGISWRAWGTMDTIMISWFYTGNPLGALQVGVTEVVTKLVLYYFHERLWGLIKWGRIFTDEIEMQEVEKPVAKTEKLDSKEKTIKFNYPQIATDGENSE